MRLLLTAIIATLCVRDALSGDGYALQAKYVLPPGSDPLLARHQTSVQARPSRILEISSGSALFDLTSLASIHTLRVLLLLLTVHADAYQAPSWACSPPPRMKNPLCPAPANGDSRCSLFSCPADAGCATENCNAVQGQVKADRTLVLDAWYQRGTVCVKSTWTLSECCSLCSSLEGCSVWSYCNNPAGCGGDCVADHHNFQYSRGLRLWNVAPTDHSTRLNPEHRCSEDGRWPYNTCTLKVAAAGIDAKAPVLEPGSE